MDGPIGAIAIDRLIFADERNLFVKWPLSSTPSCHRSLCKVYRYLTNNICYSRILEFHHEKLREGQKWINIFTNSFGQAEGVNIFLLVIKKTFHILVIGVHERIRFFVELLLRAKYDEHF